MNLFRDNWIEDNKEIKKTERVILWEKKKDVVNKFVKKAILREK